MNRRKLISMAVGTMSLAAVPVWAANTLSPVEVFKSPTCGCCGAHVPAGSGSGM